MTILLVQTFLLMLGAFLLGASLACLIRRVTAEEKPIVIPPAPLPEVVLGRSAETDRFGRALTGSDGPAVPPMFQSSGPMVEVQPAPAPSPARALEPEPAPVVEPAPAPAPRATPPAPQAVAPPPAPEPVAPPPAPEPVAGPPPAAPPAPEPVVEASSPAPAPAEPAKSPEPSYTAIAVAAAAAAAAAAELAKQKEAEQQAAFTPAPEPVPGPPDDLTRIRAIDVATQDRLYRLGVRRFEDIAGWSPSDVARMSQSLGYAGRIEQENWIAQAQILAKGGDTDYSRRMLSPEETQAPAPVAGGRLHRIIGIDPQTEALLTSNGVSRLSDIAAWTSEDASKFEDLLGQPGRVSRESWIEQARFLTRGGETAASKPTPPADAPAPAVASGPLPDASAAPQGALVTTALEGVVAASGTSYSGLRSVKSEALLGEARLAMPAAQGIDDLKRIRGIGVLIEKKLNSLGITSYEQVANWTDADIDRVSQLLDFKGRIERENWIEQARILSSGGQTEFSRRADRGEV
jgi:predicted flap endonuclease-1-like 5' DNA nuclease